MVIRLSYKNTVMLITIMKSLFVKQIVSILSLIMTAFLSSILNSKNVQHLKISNEELIPAAWHPKRWQNFCVSEDEKKEKDSILIEES